jgi:hypothetical protein
MVRLCHREYITPGLKGTLLITLGSLCFPAPHCRTWIENEKAGIPSPSHMTLVWTAVSFVYLLSSDHFISVRRKYFHMRWYEKNPNNLKMKRLTKNIIVDKMRGGCHVIF